MRGGRFSTNICTSLSTSDFYDLLRQSGFRGDGHWYSFYAMSFEGSGERNMFILDEWTPVPEEFARKVDLEAQRELDFIPASYISMEGFRGEPDELKRVKVAIEGIQKAGAAYYVTINAGLSERVVEGVNPDSGKAIKRRGNADLEGGDFGLGRLLGEE